MTDTLEQTTPPPTPTATVSTAHCRPDGGLPSMPPGPMAPPMPTGEVIGPNGERAVFLSEADYLASTMKESYTLHLIVLGVCGGLIIVGAGIGGVAAGGIIGAAVTLLLTLVGLAVSVVVNTVVGWFVSKMFAADFGTFPQMLLRFAAVTCAYTVTLAGLAVTLGPWPAILLSTPALMILLVWLIGMDMLQAFIFTTVLVMANWLFMTFMFASVATAFAG